MAPPQVRRALPRQSRQEGGEVEGNHRSTSGCCPIKVRVSASFLAARASVVVWFSRKSIRPLEQLDQMVVNK
nr:hypothetical protein [Dromedary astrovirus]